MIALLCLLTLSVGAEASKIYKWTDEQGRVHYTQTPPPASATEESTRTIRGAGEPSEGMKVYCRAVREFAMGLGHAMSSRVPLEAAVAAARTAEDKLRELGAQDSQAREVAYFVYGMEPGYRARRITVDGIATLAHTQCLTGNFAVIKGLREDTPATAGGRRSGSGWFARPGVVVTSLHVVKGAESITLHLSDGESASARLLDQDEANDLAVLATSARHLPGLPVRGEEVGIGTAVFTIGFPHANVMGVKPKLSNGVISSTAGLRDDPSQYQISVPVQAGNSGGPLLDMQGRVVGIVAAKLRANNMLRNTGDLTENVNYAIKSTRLAGMLSGVADGETASASLEQLAGAAGPSVVRIVVE
nr:trypsin-like peptidase domain-containing protein [Lysobacter sp. CAU 1642]